MLVVAGIDIGSLWAKALVLRDNTKSEMAFHIRRSDYNYTKSAQLCLGHAMRKAHLRRSELRYVVGTGYGRNRVPLADRTITEISCQAYGASHLFPQAKMVIDIGGQDIKVIQVREGQVIDFAMNDKCAAGTGRFLEVMATSLKVSLGELGQMAIGALDSESKAEISSVCTVFAESEVISLFSQGYDRAVIAAGICRAIAKRVGGLAGRIHVREGVVMCGGVAKNVGVVRAVERELGVKLLIPEEPQTVGALGAALLALRFAREGGDKD